jgi:ribosomal protein S18 acetylase RimI-like enzyme
VSVKDALWISPSLRRGRLYPLILDCLTESIVMTRLDADKFDTLEIRPFQPIDLEQVIGLWHSCNLIRPWNDLRKDIARKLRVNPKWFLVAILGQEIVGSIMVGYEGHRGWINCLAVAAPFRCRGIGYRLMERAEEILRAVGCPKINLLVRVGNQAELPRFYARLGFGLDQVVCYGKRLEADEA